MPLYVSTRMLPIEWYCSYLVWVSEITSYNCASFFATFQDIHTSLHFHTINSSFRWFQNMAFTKHMKLFQYFLPNVHYFGFFNMFSVLELSWAYVAWRCLKSLQILHRLPPLKNLITAMYRRRCRTVSMLIFEMVKTSQTTVVQFLSFMP